MFSQENGEFMDPLKECSDYYVQVRLYDQHDSFTLNDLYECFKTQIKKELEDEFAEMLGKAVACPKCHKVHFESGKCECGLEIVC